MTQFVDEEQQLQWEKHPVRVMIGELRPEGMCGFDLVLLQEHNSVFIPLSNIIQILGEMKQWEMIGKYPFGINVIFGDNCTMTAMPYLTEEYIKDDDSH